MTDDTKRVPRNPTDDMLRIARALSPQWLGLPDLIWRTMYDAAPTINEGGQAPCESTDGCTRAQVTWEQAISHAGTDHEMAAQPVPPSPTDVRRFSCHTQEDGVYESRTGEHVAYADYAKLAAALTALRAELAAESLEVTAWRTRATKAEIERDALLLRIPNVSKVEAECRTLEDWKLRAMHMEFGWSSCSRCAAQLQGRAESAEAERDALRADAERYRWLRERLTHQHRGLHFGWTLDDLLSGDDPDEAIDAARGKV